MQQRLDEIIGSLPNFMPEVFLAVAFLCLIGIELCFYHKKQDFTHIGHSLLMFTFVVAMWLIARQVYVERDAFLFGQMLFLDNKAIFFKMIVALVACIMTLHSWTLKRQWAGEFYSLMVAIVLGFFLMTLAINLLAIYLSIEVVSIASYLLAALCGNKRSIEASLKYLLFGAVSSAVMLYGMSFIYGITGTLNLSDVAFGEKMGQVLPSIQMVIGIMTLGGFLFKISAAPFHFWNPDVYEAAPTPVVSFLSVAPKATGLLVLMRLLSSLPADFQHLLMAVVVLSLTIGNFSALTQTNAKRLMAYSSIAQAGFMLVGLIGMSELGVKATTFYAATYIFANMGAFYLFDMLANLKGSHTDDIQLEDLKGLGMRYPLVGILLLVCMISLIGLPLTVGFSAKLLVFSALWEHNTGIQSTYLYSLLLFGLLNTAISLFYYLKIPFYLFFRTNDAVQKLPNISVSQIALASLITFPTIWLFFKADWLMNLIDRF
jgi:NADH-quinone oxidoreductase subunit N